MINLKNIPDSMYDFLCRNKMIKLVGEWRPTIKDVIKAKGSNGKNSFRHTTRDAINKLTL